MPYINKKVLREGRIRRIPKSGFSWIDRRFIIQGFAGEVSQHELLLYFFLCAAADHKGLSFYSDRRLVALLRLTQDRLDFARRTLEKRDLIIYRYPLYQVLSLPEEQHGTGSTESEPVPPSPFGTVPIGALLRDIM